MGSLHPWVADDISHRKSLVGMELEHACDQVLELFSEEAWLMSLDVELPEEVSPVGC